MSEIPVSYPVWFDAPHGRVQSTTNAVITPGGTLHFRIDISEMITDAALSGAIAYFAKEACYGIAYAMPEAPLSPRGWILFYSLNLEIQEEVAFVKASWARNRQHVFMQAAEYAQDLLTGFLEDPETRENWGKWDTETRITALWQAAMEMGFDDYLSPDSAATRDQIDDANKGEGPPHPVRVGIELAFIDDSKLLLHGGGATLPLPSCKITVTDCDASGVASSKTTYTISGLHGHA